MISFRTILVLGLQNANGHFVEHCLVVRVFAETLSEANETLAVVGRRLEGPVEDEPELVCHVLHVPVLTNCDEAVEGDAGNTDDLVNWIGSVASLEENGHG